MPNGNERKSRGRNLNLIKPISISAIPSGLNSTAELSNPLAKAPGNRLRRFLLFPVVPDSPSHSPAFASSFWKVVPRLTESKTTVPHFYLTIDVDAQPLFDLRERINADLQAGEFLSAGQLLNASHASLRDDYRVSCAELDFIAAVAQSEAAVAGCRMTGGGFGGSCVALVQRTKAARVSENIAGAFRDHFGRTPASFVTSAASGARLLRL